MEIGTLNETCKIKYNTNSIIVNKTQRAMSLSVTYLGQRLIVF